MRTRRNRLHIDIAEKIERDLPTFTGKSLPPVRILAGKYSVSVPTVRSALTLLESRKLIEIYPGKRAVITGRTDCIDPKHTRKSTERLYVHLRENIINGRFPARHPLPKVIYLVKKFHVTNRTVQKVFRRLLDEDIVHRQGKSFIVGKDIAASSELHKRSNPVIVLLTSKPRSWTGFCRSARTERFAHVFLREVDDCDIRLIEYYTAEGNSRLFPEQKFEMFRNMIQSLGSSYSGCLIHGKRDEIPDIEDWIDTALKFALPVVWIDRIDNDLTRPVKSAQFIRCHISEANAATQAIRFLYERGHRRIAYITTPLREGWHIFRYEILQAAIKQEGFDVTLSYYQSLSSEDWMEVTGPAHNALGILETVDNANVRFSMNILKQERHEIITTLKDHCNPRWNSSAYAGIAALDKATRTREKGIIHEWDTAIRVIWGALGLLPYLTLSVTAVIAPSDLMARGHHLRWVQELGVSVPKDLSVLSFDSAFNDSLLPLTSVDFGFHHLGYQAFHAIMGDVPIKKDRTGSIAARAKVVDRGSVSFL